MATHYQQSAWSASYLLAYSVGAIEQNPETLKHWATRCAQVVFVGGLDFGETWDRLFLAAIAGGLSQAVAQQRIGEAFAAARRGGEVAA